MYDLFIINIFAKFVMLISTHRRYRLACTVLHDASVAAPIIFAAHKKVDFTTARCNVWSSPQSPPRISVFWWNFKLQIGASSQPSFCQQTILRCGKKVGWLLCFAMFFLPNYLIGNSRPVLPSSATPPPWLSKPHAPRCALTTDSI